MAEINAKDVFDILLESLKIQADKYKSIVNQDLTHEQRKDFDSEIKQMFELLTSMTNSSTVYTLSEIQALKLQYEVKIQELQTTLDNIDVTTVKGDTGANGIDGKDGVNGLDGQNGIDGKDFTYDMFTPEQLELLKGADGQNGVDGIDGANGLSAYEIALNNGFVGSQALWLESLKGQDGTSGADGQNGIDGKDFTYDMFTPEQLELLKGADGKDGVNGLDGQNGIDGKDFTYDMFTPEQLALLKGADGQNGLDGTVTFESLTPEQLVLLKGADGKDGINGVDGKDFTYDMFTPEQLASFKGEKGEKGDNGLDGQSLTYDDLTTAQKEDLASHVTVSGGGGSSLSNIACIPFSGRLLMAEGAYTHLKTRIKYVDFLFANMQVTYFSSTNVYHSSNTFQLIPSFPINSLRFFKISGSIDSSIVLSPYVSFDGYLCFILSTFSDSFYLDLCIDIRLKNPYDFSLSFVTSTVKSNSANSQFTS